jgi:hypothetical protein
MCRVEILQSETFTLVMSRNHDFFFHRPCLETREMAEMAVHMGGWSSKNSFHQQACLCCQCTNKPPHLVAATAFCWAHCSLRLSFLVQPSDSWQFRETWSSRLLQARRSLIPTLFIARSFRMWTQLPQWATTPNECAWCPGSSKVVWAWGQVPSSLHLIQSWLSSHSHGLPEYTHRSVPLHTHTHNTLPGNMAQWGDLRESTKQSHTVFSPFWRHEHKVHPAHQLLP